IPVRRRISADLPWSTWPAVATTWRTGPSTSVLGPGSALTAPSRSALLEGVSDGPNHPIVVLRRDGPQIEGHRGLLDPAEHRRPSLAEAGGHARRILHRQEQFGRWDSKARQRAPADHGFA